MDNDNNPHFRLAGRPADYARLGIDPVSIAPFEDSQRIGTEKGRYEWWYFDAHLDDGATVVVVFYTKPNVGPNGPLAPRITINLTLPDGRTFEKFLDTKPELFSASKSGCDVRIGANRFVGDLHRYYIAATIEEISVDIELTGEVPAWRPKSGHLYFGTEGREKLFAWLPSVPYGLASVRYTIGAEEHRVSGSGYHDHNWGDVPMQTLMHNWYWARASVGPYTVIASHITATAIYGYETQIVYMLAKDGQIIADDETKVSFDAEHVKTDSKTGKPVADVMRYAYQDADTRYVVSFERQKTILQAILTARAPLFKRIIARLIGFDGAYHRFTGKVTIEKFEGDARTEIFEDHAIWELMYFGKARPQAVGARRRYPTAGTKAAGQSA
jgi:Diels-Alderase family protein